MHYVLEVDATERKDPSRERQVLLFEQSKEAYQMEVSTYIPLMALTVMGLMVITTWSTKLK